MTKECHHAQLLSMHVCNVGFGTWTHIPELRRYTFYWMSYFLRSNSFCFILPFMRHSCLQPDTGVWWCTVGILFFPWRSYPDSWELSFIRSVYSLLTLHLQECFFITVSTNYVHVFEIMGIKNKIILVFPSWIMIWFLNLTTFKKCFYWTVNVWYISF